MLVHAMNRRSIQRQKTIRSVHWYGKKIFFKIKNEVSQDSIEQKAKLSLGSSKKKHLFSTKQRNKFSVAAAKERLEASRLTLEFDLRGC